MEKTINFTLRVWRQKDAHSKGYFEDHQMEGITGDTSFLEMLDILNERLVKEHKEPIVFDHDCREGICGMCSLYINGHPHGPEGGCTTCQVYMRKFNDGDVITIEPWRSAGFPVIKDLMVDRQWTRPPASDAGHAWQHARTARRCSSSQPKSASWHSCRKDAPKRHAAQRP